MHGFALNNKQGTYHDWDHYVSWIQTNHPGQIAIALNVDNGLSSTKPMFKQIYDVYQLIESIIAQNQESFADGFHVIGHSQGALLMRSIHEMYGLNIDNFISLAGVQMGVYGLGFLNSTYSNFTYKELTNLFYTETMQKTFSLANWWSDPISYGTYLEDNVFLPVLNQLLDSTIPDYKENFLAMQGTFNAFGSPDDGTVVPYISSLFGYFDSNLNYLPMTSMSIYQNDTFGLKTLDEQKRLNLYSIPGVAHADWLTRQDIFMKFILDLLN
eukprot:gene1954-2391_t